MTLTGACGGQWLDFRFRYAHRESLGTLTKDRQCPLSFRASLRKLCFRHWLLSEDDAAGGGTRSLRRVTTPKGASSDTALPIGEVFGIGAAAEILKSSLACVCGSLIKGGGR